MGRGALVLALLAACALPAAAADLKDDHVVGRRAMEHVQALVRYGERWPGSEGHKRAQAYIIRQLQLAYAEVEESDFIVQSPYGTVAMKNIIGKIPGRSKDREIVVLAGHYDTLRLTGFVGANDGGSSAALLLELARVLGRRQPENPLTVWVVFFDGEEAFVQWGPRDGTFGSRIQAARWEQDAVLPQIKAFILVDMIGDRDLQLRRDLNSTPWLADLVWQVAEDKGRRANFTEDSMAVQDDHIPFIRRGVAAVDLIDFDYGPGNRYWHTVEDTIDRVSAQSLEIVGEVVLETVARLGQGTPAPTDAPAAPAKQSR